MTGHGEKLTRKQEQALVALLAEPTIADAARTTGIGEKTLRRWLQLPEFRVAYRAARQEVFGAAVSRLARIAGKAVDALDKHLDAERPGDSIRAASIILDHARQALELDDVIVRIEALEQQHAQPQRPAAARRERLSGR